MIKRVAIAVFLAYATRFSMVLTVRQLLWGAKWLVSAMKIVAMLENKVATTWKKRFVTHFGDSCSAACLIVYQQVIGSSTTASLFICAYIPNICFFAFVPEKIQSKGIL